MYLKLEVGADMILKGKLNTSEKNAIYKIFVNIAFLKCIAVISDKNYYMPWCSSLRCQVMSLRLWNQGVELVVLPE